MDVQRSERPKCRNIIEKMMREKNCTLHQLIEGDNKFFLSDGMRIQVRKMIVEATESEKRSE